MTAYDRGRATSRPRDVATNHSSLDPRTGGADPKRPLLCTLENTQVMRLEFTNLQHCRSCPQAV